MAEHNELGELGEDLAVEYLKQQGYTILERNWKFAKAEIDIIATKGDVLAVIEVKTRSGIDFGLPQDFVNAKKIRLLILAVNEYVESNNIEMEVRLDIIAVQRKAADFAVEHIEDAFYHF